MNLFMFQAFVPFPTALMGALHACVLRSLIRPEASASRDPHVIRKSSSVRAALVLYAVTPLFFLVPPPCGGASRAPEAAR